jgi:hypothetical protein
MKTVKHHITCNIEGLLRNYKRKKINFLTDDEGNLLTDKQAREALSKLQQKGYKLIPNDECEGFDPYGGGCPGHEN